MIHALPGMGANHRMYPDAWSDLPAFSAHDWVRYSGERSLTQLAHSMCAAKGIGDGDILIGSSLGGMVACEITKIRRIPLLFLIGSALAKEEISALLTILHPLARVAPVDWLRISARSIPAELAQMFSDAEAAFVRAMSAAIFDWEGHAAPSTKVFRIHGRHDLVIPPPANVDLLLDGGHLLAMSHPQQCVDFIRANQTPDPTTMAVTHPAAQAARQP